MVADRESYLSPSDDRATVDAVSVAAFQRIRVGGRHHGGLGVSDVTTGVGAAVKMWKGCKEKTGVAILVGPRRYGEDDDV